VRPSSPPSPPTLDELRDVALFSGLPDEQLAHFVATLDVLTLGVGEEAFAEGECGRAMFVVLSGELEVFKCSARGRRARIGQLLTNDWFGEMALLDVMPRPVTVCAVVRTRLLQLRPTDLDRLYRRDIKAYALLVMNLARQLSRKLRVAEGILADTVATVIDH
jgi:CRP-like cAMP-binding protein